jgi:threonine aldolase
MRHAIAAAEVGDEQRRLDPTTRRLERRVAELLGHEAAVFLPTGTMCNVVALRLHARAGGDEIILDRTAHPIEFEAGGLGQLIGAMTLALDGERGMFTATQLQDAIRTPGNRYSPRSRIVSVEQTTNLAGGRIWPLQQIVDVLDVARRHRLRTHMDGARLLNAVVATGIPASDYAGGFDTAWIDFTKGLGAPVGAVLAGSEELIEEAWRWKQMLGGALRQSGMLAAGCLYALDHHVQRLEEDHENARRLAEGLAAGGAVRVDPDAVETNIVVFEVDDAAALVASIADDVELQEIDERRVRAVTHLDIGRREIDAAIAAISAGAAKQPRALASSSPRAGRARRAVTAAQR